MAEPSLFSSPCPSLSPSCSPFNWRYFFILQARGGGWDGAGVGMVLPGGLRAQTHLDVRRILLQGKNHDCQVWC